HKNKLHNIHRGFTHYKYYRAFCWTDLKNFESFLKEFLKNFKNYEMLLTGDEKGGRTGSIKKESRKRNE
ncbi:hypothetical protein, partial [Streptococcus pneumoniae]|uniref:hypothetical protein n=1 Tax=Streptococcus pneumoniae TaxID=1313 RepID=UPI0006C87FEE